MMKPASSKTELSKAMPASDKRIHIRMMHQFNTQIEHLVKQIESIE